MFEEPQTVEAEEYVAQVVARREAELEGKREKKRAYFRDWYAANAEQVIGDSKRWAEENPAKVRENNKRWRVKNPGKVRQQQRRWHDTNPEKSRAKRRSDNLAKYGLSVEQYDELWAAQKQRCKLCSEDKPRGGKWVVDHCHDTGVVRGIICNQCNIGLGHFSDDPAKLQAAIDYLQRAT